VTTIRCSKAIECTLGGTQYNERQEGGTVECRPYRIVLCEAGQYCIGGSTDNIVLW